MRSDESNLDPLFFGCLISLYLFGLNSIQTSKYLRKFPNDPWQLKSYVIVIWTLELGHSILTGYTVYVTLVTDLRNVNSAMANMSLYTSMCGVVAIVIATLVHWYFAFRLYRLSGFHILPIISSIISLVHFVSFLAASINTWLHRPLTDGWRWCFKTVGILSIAVDFVLVGGLAHGLWKRRDTVARFGWWPRAVDQVMIIAIQADVVTCVATAVTLILFTTSDVSWRALQLITCRLFGISFVSSVLSTKRVGGKVLDWSNIEITMPPCNYDITSISDTDGRAASTTTQRLATPSPTNQGQIPV